MAVVKIKDVKRRAGADHPVPAVDRCKARRKQPLGDAVGLDQFGVNRVELDPGVWSTVRHWHTHEDEFVMVLEGQLTLVTDGGEVTLDVGSCAGFKAGHADAHRLENRTGALAVYLEVGSRRPALDEVFYPDDDLKLCRDDQGRRMFMSMDGTVICPAD
ncbi:MAG: cupin domain-containing protein [Pseudomonadota bacterium]